MALKINPHQSALYFEHRRRIGLNFKCGIGIHAAREKVRVANALAELPTMSVRFKRGELSYSKVRAMTRIANEENEDYLLGIAKYGTAHHVEKLVSLYRGCIRQQDNENANEAHRKRELQCHYDTDGCLVIHGLIPAAQGTLILKALDRAMEKNDQSKPYNQEVPAGTSEEPFYAQRADALAELAEIYLASDQTPTSTADRYQVIIHVSPQTLKDTPPVGSSPEARPPQSRPPHHPQPLPHRRRSPRPRGDVPPHRLRLLHRQTYQRPKRRTSFNRPKNPQHPTGHQPSTPRPRQRLSLPRLHPHPIH